MRLLLSDYKGGFRYQNMDRCSDISFGCGLFESAIDEQASGARARPYKSGNPYESDRSVTKFNASLFHFYGDPGKIVGHGKTNALRCFERDGRVESE